MRVCLYNCVCVVVRYRGVPGAVVPQREHERAPARGHHAQVRVRHGRAASGPLQLDGLHQYAICTKHIAYS